MGKKKKQKILCRTCQYCERISKDTYFCKLGFCIKIDLKKEKIQNDHTRA